MKRIGAGWLACGVVLLCSSGCGWSHVCTKTTTYGKGEVATTATGAPLVQEGCFASRSEPRGLSRAWFKREAHDDEGFRPIVERELIYAGRQDKTLRVIYREYYLDYTEHGATAYVKPPYSLDIDYDMNSTSSIVFKDWELEVLEAQQGMIRFRVAKEPPPRHFDLPDE